MDLQSLVPDHILRMHAYVPGQQPKNPDIIKLNTNESPFSPPASVIQAVQNSLERLEKYPDPRSDSLRQKIAEYYEISPDSVLAGNGSDEILSLVLRTFLQPGDSFVLPDPSYSLYPVLADAMNLKVIRVNLFSDWHVDFDGLLMKADDSGARLTVIVNPNAPTGLAEKSENIMEYSRRFSGITLVDEAYGPFCNQSLMQKAGGRLMVTSTFSKAFSLAGMRVGWIAADPFFITQIDKVRDSYNLSKPAQAAALAALENKDENNQKIRDICERRDRVIQSLRSAGFHCLDSGANFIFCSPPDRDAKSYFEKLGQMNIVVRYFSDLRVSEFVRVTVGSEAQMQTFLEATREIYG